MKLAISNIAWETHDDQELWEQFQEMKVTGIEVAPTKIWPNWAGASDKAAQQYGEKLLAAGFRVPAMQAILFNKPELQLFKKETHKKFLEHMKLVADLASAMGAKVLVFGAPKNRRRGQLSVSDATAIAIELLQKAGEICQQRNCCLGIEHNPVEYGCDFVTNVADARDLVDRVNHPGIQLHIDSAGVHMCGGDCETIIKQAGSFAHFHISEPMLEPLVNKSVDHNKFNHALMAVGYDGWVSIEMKCPETVDKLLGSVKFAAEKYLI
ncbi:sugar phosphate isomerase/epimerase family protein [Kaarinaea lacus]